MSLCVPQLQRHNLMQDPSSAVCCLTCLLLTAGGDAGETYVKLAEVQMKLESRHDAATAWVEAAKCFLKSDQRRKFISSSLLSPTIFLLHSALSS